MHAAAEIDFDQLDAANPVVDTVVDEQPSLAAPTPSDIDVDTPAVENNKRPSPPVVTAKPVKKYKREEKGIYEVFFRIIFTFERNAFYRIHVIF